MQIHDTAESGDASHNSLLCRVFVPNRNLKKTVRLDPNDTVWNVKMQFIVKMNLENEKEEDPFNFGIYLPKAGVYLDEQRQLSSYYFSDNVYFEFKSKQREQKLPESTLKKLNGRKQHKQFYEYQTSRQFAKMRSMLEKGFDPNFIYESNGESPITLAAVNDDIEGIVLFYSVGGAFLDYRSTDGKTAVHKAAGKGRITALKTLLKHGAPVNARDKQNLTPLYDACINGKFKCAELLLQSNSPIGVVDSNQRTELHQACANGFADVVDLLISYGADMNAINEPGNTPLHICASKGTKDCAAVLLKKGCEKDKPNLAGNTPFQVAIMFNNHDLAEMIASFKKEDIVPVVLLTGPKTTVTFDDDPIADGLYVPPMPPPGTTGIHPPPQDAPSRRKVYGILPPPPPPTDLVVSNKLNALDGAESIRSDRESQLDLTLIASLPPPTNMDELPPPPPLEFLNSWGF